VIVFDPSDLTQSFSSSLTSIVTTSQLMSSLFLATILVGIANTLFIVVLDRRREIGMLRALGMNRRQIVLTMILEMVLIVLIVAVVAIPLGLFNNEINSRSMEEFMSVRFNLGALEVLTTLMIILVAATLAAYLPARMAGRQDVIASLRYE
jgi:putative ABC transport system permease protein